MVFSRKMGDLFPCNLLVQTICKSIITLFRYKKLAEETKAAAIEKERKAKEKGTLSFT